MTLSHINSKAIFPQHVSQEKNILCEYIAVRLRDEVCGGSRPRSERSVSPWVGVGVRWGREAEVTPPPPTLQYTPPLPAPHLAR